MDVESIDFLPTLRLFDLKSKVVQTTRTEKLQHTNIERSEALESLGVAQFYNGDYADAVVNLEAAIAPRFLKLKSKKRLIMIKTLLGSLFFRFGELPRAVHMFKDVIELSKKAHDNYSCAMAMSNLAIVQMRDDNAKDALKNARGAIELLQKIYSKRCTEFLQAVRVIISIYIKTEEYARAESLAEEHDFPLREKALILSGIKFAQSEYHAAITILTKCLEQEFGQSNGFKPPTLDRESTTTTAADLANPWSKFSSPTATTASAPGTEGAAAAPVVVKSALIQPTKTYMDDINHEILGSMINYNLTVLKRNNRDIGLTDTVDKLDRFVKQVADRRVTVNNKADRTQAINSKLSEDGVGALSQDDPYVRLPWDKHPSFMPFDSYMYPAVALSSMMAAQSEFDVLTCTLSSGLSIEAGRVGGDIGGLDVALRQLQQEFRGSLLALQTALPSALAEKSSSALLRYQAESWNTEGSIAEGAETPYTERAGTPSTTMNSGTGSPQNTSRGARPTSPPAGLPYEDSEVSGEGSALGSRSVLSMDAALLAAPADPTVFQELPDIAQGNYTVQRFQILKDMVSNRFSAEEMAGNVQRRLKEEHGVYMADTGRLLTAKEVDNILHPKISRSKTLKSNKRGLPGSPGTDAAGIAEQNKALADSRTGSRGDDLHMGDLDSPKRGGSAAAGGNFGLGATTAGGRAVNELPQITFNAKKLASGTLQSELFPLTQTFGRDQATLWIEWAISKAGAMSFGFLGHSCLDPLPDAGFGLSQSHKNEDGELSEEFLSQVRARLLELEAALSNPSEHSKLTNVKGVRIEARVVNFFLLFKVTVQLGLKKEAGQCLMQLEDACASLRKQQCDSFDSVVYQAFALRFRLDYEEWNISHAVSDAWLLSHIVNKLLPLCRQYRAACALTGDPVLQRDAIKRQINMYSQVGAVPLSDESDVHLLSYERVAALTAVELEAHEQNVEWVQKNGVSRAMVLFEEMGKLAAAALAT